MALPSFSFLKSSKGKGEKPPIQAAAPHPYPHPHPHLHDSGVQLSNDSTEKVQQRQSKRDYFRGLLKVSNLSLEARANRRKTGQFAVDPSAGTPQLLSPSVSKTPDPPVSPMNKPLPPPPPPQLTTTPPDHPQPKSPVKLERIISPVLVPDLHKIFSGAPQFFARSEGHNTGAPHPSVCFPWDDSLNIRDSADHWKIHDEAWGCVTAWPHITVQGLRRPSAAEDHHERQKACFLPRCRERPSMLSMQGLERGTMGFQAALEMGVADALEISDEHLNTSPEHVSEQRRIFLNGKDGLRPVTDSILVDQLLDISELYHEDPSKHHRQSVELYTQLFTMILFPPTRVTEHDDPYSLKVQIEALVQVLAAPTVWFDFSLVEWRIRLGQILWGASTDLDSEDGISINNQSTRDPGTERYWLLVQILLACELLIRLDAISANMDHGLEAILPNEIHKFDQMASSSVKWSLLLARAWLENINIERPRPGSKKEKEKKSTGWFTTSSTTSGPPPTDGLQALKFHGRHQTRQLSGLLHFARNIQWPDMDALTAKAASNGITVSDSVQSTPIGTPLSISTNRSSSYFARRPAMNRAMSLHRHVSTIIHPAGWLSNSYLSGLILSGEGLSHFLISTLLENDPDAVSRLGEEANLYGGFVYRERSFWSKACIIGRVLAAGKGATECMGWVASDVVPKGMREGWVDVDVELEAPIDPAQKSSKPRLHQKQSIEHDGHLLGGADYESVLPGDFTLPSDDMNPSQLSIEVDFESLDLFESANETPTGDDWDDHNHEHPTPLSDISGMSGEKMIRTYSAMMRFTITLTRTEDISSQTKNQRGQEGELKLVKDIEEKEMNVALNHDVHFVTAHPCFPSPGVEILTSAMSTVMGKEGCEGFVGHPLHKGFTYTTIPLSTLVYTPISTPFEELLSLPTTPDANSPTDPLASVRMLSQSSTHTTSSTIPKVLIIDCTSPPPPPHTALTNSSSATHLTPSSLWTQEQIAQNAVDGCITPISGSPVPPGHAGSSEKKGSGKDYGRDEDILARALCAERGWNAVVSRRGRGCLACAVRECGSLGGEWRVVLRV
ncbi:uncharacterized protein RAG0_05769 [Rhynchosporium agropyri]|uniref:Uncharacterized protein n=1 Tax=Rhynchosporium agropyri TaxID=914238 RepID=A0A1E1KES2_9HELO|nr:uncharacterized protein RAG0_05769 [Rhynchosporium agropyri]